MMPIAATQKISEGETNKDAHRQVSTSFMNFQVNRNANYFSRYNYMWGTFIFFSSWYEYYTKSV